MLTIAVIAAAGKMFQIKSINSMEAVGLQRAPAAKQLTQSNAFSLATMRTPQPTHHISHCAKKYLQRLAATAAAAVSFIYFFFQIAF